MIKLINPTTPELLHSGATDAFSPTKVAEGLPYTGATWPWARAEGDPSQTHTFPQSVGLIEASL